MHWIILVQDIRYFSPLNLIQGYSNSNCEGLNCKELKLRHEKMHEFGAIAILLVAFP